LGYTFNIGGFNDTVDDKGEVWLFYFIDWVNLNDMGIGVEEDQECFLFQIEDKIDSKEGIFIGGFVIGVGVPFCETWGAEAF